MHATEVIYYLKANSICKKCPENCDFCRINEKNNKVECISCSRNYSLNPQKECIYCGENWRYCLIDTNSKAKCSSCYNEKFLYENQFITCPNNCIECKIENNQIKCTKCLFYDSVLHPNGTCIYCEGCNGDQCFINDKGEPACKSCNNGYYFLESENKCVKCEELDSVRCKGCKKCELILQQKNMIVKIVLMDILKL